MESQHRKPRRKHLQPIEKLHRITVLTEFEDIPGEEDSSGEGLGLDLGHLCFFHLGYDDIREYIHQMNQQHSLYKWHSDQRLQIIFEKCKTMSDEELRLVLRFLKRNFSDLTKLKIDFTGRSRISEKGVEYVSEIARNLPQLKELQVFLHGFPFTSKGLETLGYNISRQLLHLEFFKLSFQDLSPAKNEDLRMLFLGFGKHFSKLKRLNLEFGGGLQSETFDVLVKQISKNFTGLQEFTLSIGW